METCIFLLIKLFTALSTVVVILSDWVVWEHGRDNSKFAKVAGLLVKAAGDDAASCFPSAVELWVVSWFEKMSEMSVSSNRKQVSATHPQEIS